MKSGTKWYYLLTFTVFFLFDKLILRLTICFLLLFLVLIREAIQKPFSLSELQRCTLLITDFGMACRSSQLAPQQSKLGTVAYAAPEVCRQVSPYFLIIEYFVLESYRNNLL